MQDLINKIHNADCLEKMKEISDKSIDMILCDLPYGTTACKWDTIIPFEPLWQQYKRIIKDNGAIVLTASQPFTSRLVMSNIDMFKYEWIWEKEKGVGYQIAKFRPMQEHENILIFCLSTLKYNPIMELRDKPYTRKGCVGDIKKTQNGVCPISNEIIKDRTYTHKYPKSIKRFTRDKIKIHPTQKPVALFEYLIKTYTNEGDLVLDNCSGSGTTAIACLGTNRKYICIEKDEIYYQKSLERVEEYNKQLKLF